MWFLYIIGILFLFACLCEIYNKIIECYQTLKNIEYTLSRQIRELKELVGEDK